MELVSSRNEFPFLMKRRVPFFKKFYPFTLSPLSSLLSPLSSLLSLTLSPLSSLLSGKNYSIFVITSSTTVIEE